ncbi:hypothetical protein JD844_020136 [Phrynosoma platyrhinos]|uniref:Uncharacterized protein n=1 Tax=Phrynosoma platyrhinos TaxID=52577 RepID=A0ABQ7TRU1_PHRPL|nr:hypothetical protein JD844_020136 [Phrynosoma platyrhinos]
MWSAVLLWVILGVAGLLQPTLALRVSAFNIRTFGDSKLSNKTIADILVSIVSDYDITLVQESSQVPSSGTAMLERGFWALQYKAGKKAMVSVVPFHGWQDVLFLGDLNADCSFVRPEDWAHIRLRTSGAFQWLIPDAADTTVSHTDCAYDRCPHPAIDRRDGHLLPETPEGEKKKKRRARQVPQRKSAPCRSHAAEQQENFASGETLAASLCTRRDTWSMNRLLMLILGLASLLYPASTLRICAFNIQSFGDTKLSDENISKSIVKILSRYDIALVQEVRDSDLSAVSDLMERLNRASKYEYAYEISESLGRENYKEMYLFLYRTGSVSVLDKYQYPNKNNAFSRAPFIVKFSAPESKESELILVPLHTPPNEAVAEIDALYDVYLKIIDKWGTDKDWSSIRLRTSEVFKWLIPDSEDTTVGDSDCAYDRIVVSGSQLKKWVKSNSAKVYDFQKDLKLSQEEALAVSDHFPVEVTLKSQ